jgi:hypothetical protein
MRTTTSDNVRRALARKGLVLIFAPAAAFIPFLRFVTICPPQYGEVIAVTGLALFVASELMGLRCVYRCFIGRVDMVGAACIIGAAVGIIVVVSSLGTLMLTLQN